MVTLLQTKLHVPGMRPGLVVRPRLVEQLNRGAESKLTLISAPAGFGKTSLLAGWLAELPAGRGTPAWLSLDAADNQHTTFWAYVVAALQTVVPGVGAGIDSLLREPPPPRPELALTSLINELSGLSEDVLLVLDDYHVIDLPEIQRGIAYLLGHLPRQVHLMLATRADPALPLARLRATGELVEIRAADLRFTPGEAGAYLNDTMGLDLATHDVERLEDRTEGWIAALQLAALSMQGRADVAGFIAGFAGSDRYIVDYLVEEVLQRQNEEVRTFLLHTSILDRLTGPLCNAVTAGEGGQATLEALDRGNLFIVPLDDRRRWYRYHHLFADVLRARLLDEQPDRAADLHRRASLWHEQNGDRSEAIRHALAGGDFERAADLVEIAVPAWRQARHEATMRRWLDALPDDLYEVRPVLAAAYVGSRLVSGEIEGVEMRLSQAERWMDPGPQAGDEPGADMVVVDQQAFESLPGTIAVYRAALARARGDTEATIMHARRALGVIGEDDHLERGGAAGLLGLAHWSGGDLNAAHRWWAEAATSLEQAGHISDVLGCHIALADIRMAQGRLGEAMRTYQRGLEKVSASDEVRGSADMHVGISELFRERNDLAAATEHLLAAEELGEHAGLPQNAHRFQVARARLRQAGGDLDSALDHLDRAERLYVGDYFPDVRPITAWRARMWIAQQRLQPALTWARDRRLAAEDDLDYLREFEHITLARLMLAQAGNPLQEALDFLGRLLQAAEDGERTGSVIEILTLRAIAQRAADDQAAAVGSLERAITLAEPEGHVRIFLDEGAAISPLVKLAAEQPQASDHARLLLSALGRTETPTPMNQNLVHPLTERELEVLRLLNGNLAGPEIARRLYVSLNTLRTHTKSIYSKLGVNSRRAAVRRAAELGLLPH